MSVVDCRTDVEPLRDREAEGERLREPETEAEPYWFGPARAPLLGRLHRPLGGRARGGVLICPPVGIELAHSHYVLRCLARELTACGFAVLRFDYAGTGQSAGDMNDSGRGGAASTTRPRC